MAGWRPAASRIFEVIDMNNVREHLERCLDLTDAIIEFNGKETCTKDESCVCDECWNAVQAPISMELWNELLNVLKEQW